MKLKQVKEHLHVFRLERGQRATDRFAEKIYSCIDPDCWFYAKAPKILGKRAECFKCHKDYIVTYEALRRATPTCSSCVSGVKATVEKEIHSSFAEMLKDELHLD